VDEFGANQIDVTIAAASGTSTATQRVTTVSRRAILPVGIRDLLRF
jgi:hypothetical protein